MVSDMVKEGNIFIKGPGVFREDVVALVRKVNETRTGRAVTGNIGSLGKVIVIPEDPSCNPSDLSIVTPAGKLALRTSTIAFSEGVRVDEVTSPIRCPGWDNDISLLHEIVHAMFVTQGVLFNKPLPAGFRRFDDLNEFYTILLENIARSEKYGGSISAITPRLRRDHAEGMMRGQEASDFLRDPDQYQLVLDFCLDGRLTAMCEKLAVIDTAFNPIRELYLEALASSGGSR